MIKVLLADDQELIRQSLSFVMSKQEDIEMVGTAANGCEALELVEEKQPDVVLLDIRPRAAAPSLPRMWRPRSCRCSPAWHRATCRCA